MARKICEVNNNFLWISPASPRWRQTLQVANLFKTHGKNKNAIGFSENKVIAQEGGSVSGKARKDLEEKSGKKVSTKINYLQKPEGKKRLRLYWFLRHNTGVRRIKAVLD